MLKEKPKYKRTNYKIGLNLKLNDANTVTRI